MQRNAQNSTKTPSVIRCKQGIPGVWVHPEVFKAMKNSKESVKLGQKTHMVSKNGAQEEI